MKHLVLFMTILLFVFSGVIQGTVCTIVKPLNLVKDSCLSPLENILSFTNDFDSVAWAKKDKDKKDKKDNDQPIPTPEPATFILLGTGVGLAALLRKKFKK